MDLLWFLLIIILIGAVAMMFSRRFPLRRETVVKRRPRRSRVVERETTEPTAEGTEGRVVEREVPEDRA